jgi:hypothetical protein
MHRLETWPPSDDIIPLLVSFHITPSAEKILNPKGIAFLKKHEPVGCRDNRTKELLQQNEIRAYFSGCLTLTLGRKYKSDKKTGKIYFVDAYFGNILRKDGINPIINAGLHLPMIIKNISKIVKIYIKMGERNPIKRFFRAASFYSVYRDCFSDDLLFNAEYITHNIRLNGDEARFSYAEGLIKKYSEAYLVITSRIHCALPCLGLETPIIFINSDNLSLGRYDGIIELFRVIKHTGEGLMSEDELIKRIDGKITSKTKIENKKDYIKLKEELEKRCVEFIEHEI